MELFQEMERLKLKFIAAYRRLCDEGMISESDFEEVLDLVDELDETNVEDVKARLEKFKPVSLDKIRSKWKTSQKKGEDEDAYSN